jgi:enterobactin synthetase component D
MVRNREYESHIKRLFPPDVRVCLSTALSSRARLLTEELPGTEKMVEQRLLEFTHGRDCARVVLNMCGLGDVAVPRGNSREPIWPRGIVGSISHTGSLAAAVAARTDDLAGIGLDIESADPLSEDIVEMVCRQDEDVGSDGGHAKLLFSIKEAIYKCIYPTVGTYVDFKEVKVSLNKNSCIFTANTDAARQDLTVIERVQGAYCTVGGLVFSGAWLCEAN